MKTTHRGESRQRGTSENSQTRYISRRHPKEQPDKPEITPIKGQGRAMTGNYTESEAVTVPQVRMITMVTAIVNKHAKAQMGTN